MVALKVSRNCGRIMTKMKDNDIPWGKMHIEIIEDVTQKIYDSYFIQFPAIFKIIEL
jgi:hypothetical protein